MSEGTWNRSNVMPSQIGNVVGYDIIARDGSIGHISKRSRRTDSKWLVVDTGFWVFGHKRLIPAAAVTRVDHDERSVTVAMKRCEIKSAPDCAAGVANRTDARSRYQTL